MVHSRMNPKGRWLCLRWSCRVRLVSLTLFARSSLFGDFPYRDRRRLVMNRPTLLTAALVLVLAGTLATVQARPDGGSSGSVRIIGKDETQTTTDADFPNESN